MTDDSVFHKWTMRYLFEYLAALPVYIAACWICIPRARVEDSQFIRISWMLCLPRPPS